MKQKITVRSVEAIQPGPKDIIMWDTEIPGFCVKVTPKGKRTYLLYYRTKSGQQRRPSIGVHGAIKPEAAREIARRWAAEIASGGDPSRTRSQQRKAPTVRDLVSRYLNEHAGPRKKTSSIVNDKRMIEKKILPAFATMKIADISRDDMARLHHKLCATPYEANRVLALCSKMFQLAERWGMRPDGSNPAKNIDRFPERKRERYLNENELQRLWQILESDEIKVKMQKSVLLSFKLLILTGRRLGEILTLEWSFLDLQNATMCLPSTKTGALTVPMAPAVVHLLDSYKNECGQQSRYVLPGKLEGRPLVNVQKPWRFVRNLAGLNDVRIHDLRHTYASRAVGLGMSLPLIGRLLGHSQPATTARYAHLAQDPLVIAAKAVDESFNLTINSENVCS